VMTPKSLLRLPAATSSLDQLTAGGFQPVVDDPNYRTASGSDRVKGEHEDDRGRIQRIVLCSGKVYYDLAAAREKSKSDNLAILRLEQFYPFPATLLREIVAQYPNANELFWCQEEPHNMGGWTFVEPRLENLLPQFGRPHYAGRAASASPATGSYAIHQLEQAKLIAEALTFSES
jgi:2-oxoglutarate dehydrogenase complex dehydrogenase (E1) component-like enzyme